MLILLSSRGADKPLRVHRCAQALLQRLDLLRSAQTPPRTLSLATQALVATAAPLRHGHARLQHVFVLFPAAARRSQLAGHVHPRHGICDVRAALVAAGGSAGGLPHRSHGPDGDGGVCRRSHRDSGLEVRHLHPKYQQRFAAAGSGRLLRLQVRRRHRHPRRRRDFEWGHRNGRMGRLDGFHIYIPC